MTEFYLPYQCPVCGSEEFVQSVSGKSILSFQDDMGGIFLEEDWEPYNDPNTGSKSAPIRCLECNAEIDEIASMREERIIFMQEDQLQELQEINEGDHR